MASRWFRDFRAIPPEAILVISASVLPSLVLGMAFTDLPYHLTIIQGLPDLLMGTIIMVMGIAVILASPPMGVVADRYGRKRVLVISNLVMSASVILFAIVRDPAILLIVAVIKGVCEAGCSVSSVALLAEKTGPAFRTPGFALMGFASTTAFALGGFAIPLVIVFERIGFDTRRAHIGLYIVLAVLSFASTLLVLRIRESKATGNRARPVLSATIRRTVFGYSLSGFIIGLGTGVIIPLMTRWLFLMYGVTDVVSGPLLSAPGLLTGLGIIAIPLLTRRRSLVKSIIVVQGVAGLSLLMIPFSPNFIVAGGFYAGRALLMNMAGVLQQSFIAGMVPEEELGAVAGISSAIWRTPNTVSTALGAGLIGAGFMDLPFYIGAFLYGVSIALFWLYFRDVRPLGDQHER